MSRVKKGRYDAINASVTARQLVDHAVGMTMNLVHSDDYGVYADAARYDLSQIKKDISIIEAELANAPSIAKSRVSA